MLSCSRTIDFCAGHRVFMHESKCANLHGHNYRAEISASAYALDTIGRVIDFSELKRIIEPWIEQHWDHGFLLLDCDPAIEHVNALTSKLFVCDGWNPTAENMAAFLIARLGVLFNPTGIRIDRIRLWETRKCYVDLDIVGAQGCGQAYKHGMRP